MPAIDSPPQTETVSTGRDAGPTGWTRLESRVGGVMRRHRINFLSTGVCLAVAVLFAVFLGFSAADIIFKLEAGTRVLFVGLALIGMAGAVLWRVIRPWRSLGGPVQVARSVEDVYPELEDQLSTALEYGQNPKLVGETSSPALVGALVNQTADRSEQCDFARTIHWRALGIAALAAFLLTAGLATYAKSNPRLFKTTLARFVSPTAAIPPPTLTVITEVQPGDRDVPVESNVPVEAVVDGRQPDTATLSVWIGEKDDGRWEDRPMDRGEDGHYRATMRRLLDSTRYKVRAGDDESREFRVDVYRKPEISEFVLRLEHPAYTGRPTETLAPGAGDVRALKGSTVHVELKANTDLTSGQITFKSGRPVAPATVDAADKRKATASFKIDADDEYQIHVANAKDTGSSSLYSIRALKDRYPRVYIRKPERDLMVHRDQTVQVEITSDDDVGVGELGIFHSIGTEETKVMVRKLDPTTPHAEGKLVWELGQKGLKGGEVIAYYAYALDNDTVSGPKMSKSDIQFLTVYDEEEYASPQTPQKQPGTPPAVKELDKLIDAQKKLLKETFAQARLKEVNREKQALADKKDPEQDKKLADQEKAAAARTADAQKALRGKVQDLLDKVKAELEAAPAEEPEPAEGDEPKPPKPMDALGENEVKHMEAATDKMSKAEDKLKVPDAPEAVKPETEALRHLSETRRLLLSDKQGNPRFKMAMDKQSKKKRQQEQNQANQDQQDAKQELAEMPKMLEREKQTERDVEELVERKKNNPPPPQGQPQTQEQKQEQDQQRKLQRQAQDELTELAKDAQERAKKLEQLAARNQEMQPAAQKMQQAGDKLEQAAQQAGKQDQKSLQEAKDKTHQAYNDTKDAQRALRDAMEKQIRQELANLNKDAQDLAERQHDLAQKAEQAQNDQQQQGQQQSQQGQQQQQQGQQQQQAQQGQQQQGQQQQGQQQQGQQQQGQQQQGQQQGQQAQGQQQGQQPQPGQQAQQGQQQGKEGQQGQQAQGQQGQQPGQQQGKEGQQGQAQAPNGRPQDQQSSAQGKSGSQRLQAMAGEQRDIQDDLKELGERLEQLAQRAQDKGLGGTKQLEQASQQAKSNAPANQAADKAQQAMAAAKAQDAKDEAARAAKALDQLARTVQDSAQKTAAADMKALAGAMKQLQALAKEQADIGKELGQKRDPAQLGQREEKVADGARDLAAATDSLEVLRRHGRSGTAKEKLEESAKHAASAAEALKGQDTATAKSPADKAEKSLNQALNEMERAAGKTMEQKAREAKNLAKSARENEEKSVAAAKDLPNVAPDQKLEPAAAPKRDEAAAKQNDAARDAKKLEHALQGLEELAKDANPAAAAAAHDARDTAERAELPKAMDDLAKGMAQIGEPKKSAENKNVKTPTPAEAAAIGEELAQVVRKVEKGLDSFVAEAVGSQLDRLRSMEQDARDAAKKTEQLAQRAEKQDSQKQDTQNPNDAKTPSDSKSQGEPSKQGDPKDLAEAKDQNKKNDPSSKEPGKKPEPTKDPNAQKDPQTAQKPTGQPDESKTPISDAIERLEKEMQRLQTKLGRLEPNAPEILKMREAITALQEAREQSKSQKADPKSPPAGGEKNLGGPAFKRTQKSLDEVTGGLVNRIERLLRAREVRPEEDEDAPKEYRSLVDKYYRALSEDLEEK